MTNNSGWSHHHAAFLIMPVCAAGPKRDYLKRGMILGLCSSNGRSFGDAWGEVKNAKDHPRGEVGGLGIGTAAGETPIPASNYGLRAIALTILHKMLFIRR